jgi:mRNA-degrading endonuclease RelE of RelBE toxin-antitoxin system
MDKIKKYLSRLSPKDKVRIDEVVDKLRSRDTEDLQIKKLKGLKNKFRVRIGKNRIIFKGLGDELKILDIDKKDDNTYKF